MPSARAEVEKFVAGLAPAPSEADLLAAAGDEASLRQALELEPDHPEAVVGLARLLLAKGDPAEALKLLATDTRDRRDAPARRRGAGWPSSRSRCRQRASTRCSTGCSTG